MRKPILIALAVVLGLIATTLMSVTAYAQGRTTPVEVKNALSLSTDGNIVQAEQRGLWSVYLAEAAPVTQSGTWLVGISGNTNVTVTNTPYVNIQNNPSVSVTNTPTIKIDSTTNTVKCQTANNGVTIWSGDQIIAAGNSLVSSNISCAGYKELRFVIVSNTTSANAKVKLWFFGPSGGASTCIGEANFGTPTSTICSDANFSAGGGICMMRFPVMGNTCYVSVYNGTASAITILGNSWAYLVN